MLFLSNFILFTFREFINERPFLIYILVFGITCLLLASMLIFSLAKYREISLNARLEHSKFENQRRQDFLSNMSHEIRTPMNAIIGLTDVINMSSASLPPGIKEKLDKLYSSAHYLLALINNILDMSKIENQKMLLAIDPFSISSMIESLKHMLEPEAKRYNVNLVINSLIIHDVVIGDELRLKQVLINLISNAFKFTPSNQNVYLTIKERNSDNNKIIYYFEVKDTGIGIPPQDQERVFAPFEQIYTSTSKSAGTGLGLPISQSIIKLMGGDIKLISDIGEGSEFSFELTFNAGQIPEINRVIKNNFIDKKKILVVEDNDINAEIMVSFLEIKDAIVDRVENGRLAFEIFEDKGDNYYDLILMDIQMPIMNGLTATRQIRMIDTDYARTIPIIAMTANSFIEDIEKAYEAGMNRFISKPIDVNILYETLNEIFKSKGASS